MVRDFLKENLGQFVVADEPAEPAQAAGARVFNPTGKKPFEIQFLNNVRRVNGWPSVLKELCVLIYGDFYEKEDFGRVLTIQGSKNPYFSRDGSNLRRSEWIEDIGYYVERNGIGSSVVMSVCEQALRLLGYPQGSLEIRAKDSGTQAYASVQLPR